MQVWVHLALMFVPGGNEPKCRLMLLLSLLVP